MTTGPGAAPPSEGPSIPRGRFRLAKISRAVVAAMALVLFYWGLFKFSVPKLRPKARVVRVLAAQESRELSDLSQSLLDKGRFEEAIQPIEVLHEAYPENYLYIRRLAEIYGRLGRFKEEARCWEQFLDVAPRPIEGCPQIGDAYWKQGEAAHQDAISAYERCLGLEPTNTDSIFYLAHALEMDGQSDRAAEFYEKGLALSPGYIDMRLGLARAWLHQEKYEDAKKAALEILIKSPGNVDGLLIMGLVYFRQGDLAQAKKFLEKAAKLSPDYWDIQLALAQIYEREKNVPEALAHYNKLLEIRPDEEMRVRRDALMNSKR